ncbi:MAG: hypothetical protein KGS44_08615 [Alphaproteobacteria bacterium]|jgi:YD repeat-containing protein|nr:hypothetical protein [Alphaproteobacteria bacterium]
MRVSRRSLLALLSTSGVAVVLARDALAQSPETVTYQYDVQGRITRATYSNGVVVEYAYDAAGNRTQVVRSGAPPPPPPVFTATIAVPAGPGVVNLRALANAAGYNGLQNATITFQVANAATITGAAGTPNGGVAIDTGVWPSGSYTITLTLQVSGQIHGGGGSGGEGAETQNGVNGGIGGDALFVQENIAVLVNAGGAIRGGGGGGGGGGSWVRDPFGEPQPFYGGGGGGGFPNGAAGGPNGAAGTGSGGGAGGTGQPGMPVTRVNGAGGAGGGAGAAGASGNIATGSGGPGDWGEMGAGIGGAAGFAIRKNGRTVTVTNNGTISGTVG